MKMSSFNIAIHFFLHVHLRNTSFCPFCSSLPIFPFLHNHLLFLFIGFHFFSNIYSLFVQYLDFSIFSSYFFFFTVHLFLSSIFQTLSIALLSILSILRRLFSFYSLLFTLFNHGHFHSYTYSFLIFSVFR